MARPIKDGVDYFPFDVSLDEKFELIEAEFGLTGFAVIVKLYQRIYSRGYYCEWTKEVALLFGRSVGLGGNAVSEIVSACIRRGIFDIDMYDKYEILTSAGIQKRYFEAVSRRKNVNFEKRYLLVDYADFLKNVHINWVNDNINSKNDDTNTQTRVNKSKEKDSKEEYRYNDDSDFPNTLPYPVDRKTDKSVKHKCGEYKHVLLSDEEKKKLIYEYGEEIATKAIEFLDEYIEYKGYKAKNHYLAIRKWVIDALSERKQKAKQSTDEYSMRSFDIDDFFAAAIRRGYEED